MDTLLCEIDRGKIIYKVLKRVISKCHTRMNNRRDKQGRGAGLASSSDITVVVLICQLYHVWC